MPILRAAAEECGLACSVVVSARETVGHTLIILDTDEPAADAQLCAKTHAGEPPPIVAIIDNRTQVSHLLDAGIDDVIEQPITIQSVASRIRVVDHRRHLLRTRHQEDAELRTLVADLPLLIYCVGTTGKVNFAAGRELGALGLSPSQVLDQTVNELFADEPQLVSEIEQSMRGETVVSVTTLGDNVYRTTCSPIVRNGTVEGVVAVFANAVERYHVEEALRRTADSFRTLIESSPDAVMVHRFGRLVYVNTALRTLLGYATDTQLVGRPFLDMVVPSQRESVTAHLKLSMAADSIVTDEVTLMRADGSTAIVEVRAMQILFDGEPAVVAMGRDMTERRQLQAQLLQADRLASMGRLAGGIGHEINNPLAYIMANLVYLSEELERTERTTPLPNYEEMRSAIGETRDGAARVREIVRGLTSFLRTDTAQISSIDVRTLMNSALQLTWNQLRSEVCITTDYQDVPLLKANEATLGQAFLNIIMNAAEAVRGNRNELQHINISIHFEAAQVAITITDSGPGIDRAIVERVFEPFFTSKPTGQGTGLSLSVCHSIVTQLGGNISVVETNTPGCTMRVVLPVDDNGFEPSHPQERLRILIVGRETPTLRTLQATLRGHILTLASSASGATPAAQARDFDLVICDEAAIENSIGNLLATLTTNQPRLTGRVLLLDTPTQKISHSGVTVVAKPIAPAQLHQAIRECLHS